LNEPFPTAGKVIS